IGLRGPGETQLETDRRLLAIRIKQINRRLDQVRRQREQNRGSRRKAEIASAVLVGYTNAGKSTLFNSLTTGDVYAADQLFATLDTTLRKIELPGGQEAILADTVGFLSDLPHELIDAFHATLLETRDADLLLHVVDAANDHSAEQVQAVDEVLRLVGAQSIPQVLVMNKIDRTGQPGGIRYSSDGQIERIYVSAVTGEGIVDMQQALQALLQAERINGVLKLNARQGALRAALFEERAVRDESVESDGSTVLTLDLNRYRWHQLCKRYDVKATELLENATPVARQA
ncbi:MAG: GTPase HflX, partial [Pseudomonadota bacterium]